MFQTTNQSKFWERIAGNIRKQVGFEQIARILADVPLNIIVHGK